MGKAKERFKEKTLELWRQRLGKKADLFRFEDMLTVLNTVRAAEKLSKDKISVKTQALLDAYTFEKIKAEAIKEFEKPKK